MCSAFYFNNLVQLWNESVEHFHMCNNNTYTVTREYTPTQFKIAENEMLVFMKLEKLIRLYVKQLRQLIRTVCTLEAKQPKYNNSNTQSNGKSQTKQFKLEMSIGSNSAVSWEQNLTQTAIYFLYFAHLFLYTLAYYVKFPNNTRMRFETSNSIDKLWTKQQAAIFTFQIHSEKNTRNTISINLQHKNHFA